MAAAKTKGLGKGLASLLGDVDIANETDNGDSAAVQAAPQTVKLRLVEPNRNQPRKDFSEEELKELADSIAIHGIISPLIVVKRGEHYMIIAGERRWRAAKMAGLKEVPVIVKEYSEREIDEISLIENLQRSDLNPIEEALAYDRLIREYDLTQEELSERVSKSRTVITNSLRLLKLPENVRALVESRQLSLGHAKVLLGLDTPEKQTEAAQLVIDGALSVRETETLVKNFGKEKPEKKAFSNEAEYKKAEERLAEILKTKVKISRKGENTGRIIIDFCSVEDIERIISHIK